MQVFKESFKETAKSLGGERAVALRTEGIVKKYKSLGFDCLAVRVEEKKSSNNSVYIEFSERYDAYDLKVQGYELIASLNSVGFVCYQNNIVVIETDNDGL